MISCKGISLTGTEKLFFAKIDMKKVNPIFIILIFALLVRLIHINFPVSGWHEWRQADTAAIAKNYYENGFDILNPEIDWGGVNNHVESEFQLYPFVVSLLYYLFGFTEIWGRLVSILCSLFTVFGLYLLTKSIINKKTALWSAFIYAILPLNIYFARVMMPEATMMMAIVFGIYFFYKWIEYDRTQYLILSCLFTTIAVLLKIPTLYIGLPLLYLAYQKYRLKTFLNWKLILYTLAVLVLTALWYYHAHQLYENGGRTFQIWEFGSDKWGNFKLWITPGFYYDIIYGSLIQRHLTYPGFIICLIGFFIKRENKYEKLFDVWVISLLIYVLIVAQGNRQHDYYQLPIILPLVVFIGKVFGKYLTEVRINFIKYKTRYSLLIISLILILFFSFRFVNGLMKMENLYLPYFTIAKEVKKVSGKNDLIITLCDGNPIYLYTADRKGWISAREQFDNEYLEQRIKEGAKLFTGEKRWIESDKSKFLFAQVLQKYSVIENNNEYFLIDLRKAVR